MTIRARLTWLVVGLVCLAGVLDTVIETVGLADTLYRTVEQDMVQKSAQVASYLADLDLEVSKGGRPLSLEAPDALPRLFSGDGTLLQLTAADGRVLNRSLNLGEARLPAPRQAGSREVDLPPGVGGVSGDRALMVTTALKLPGGAAGWLEVAFPLQGTERTLRQIDGYEIGTWLVLMVLAAAIGSYLTSRALAPLSGMAGEVERIGFDELGRRLTVQAPPRDEVDRLGLKFNALFARLEAAFAAQQRFVADASHELKNPLTGIRGNLDLIRRRSRTHPDEVERWAETAIAEVDRMGRLVRGMLELAQLESPDFALDPRPVGLDALVRQALSPYEQTPRLALDLIPVQVLGDPDRLHQVVINLVDNALKATEANGGEVRVSTRREGGVARLVVADRGAGIPADQQAQVFERFMRLDRARPRGGGNVGLGLPIVAAIVRASGGDVGLESASGEGTRFTVSLPLAPDG